MKNLRECRDQKSEVPTESSRAPMPRRCATRHTSHGRVSGSSALNMLEFPLSFVMAVMHTTRAAHGLPIVLGGEHFQHPPCRGPVPALKDNNYAHVTHSLLQTPLEAKPPLTRWILSRKGKYSRGSKDQLLLPLIRIV